MIHRINNASQLQPGELVDDAVGDLFADLGCWVELVKPITGAAFVLERVLQPEQQQLIAEPARDRDCR